ncbi:rCG22320 [Rattus norvegicus]|uniref:RCG22320 n=1 Tax=Rattus norvegicus TaxID=10116 RepID=A6IPI8_RAT|nr:rCG22320 [Rattus norvegicus]
MLIGLPYRQRELPSCDGLHMLGPGSSTIRRCGLVGGSVSLWGCIIIEAGMVQEELSATSSPEGSQEQTQNPRRSLEEGLQAHPHGEAEN